MHAKFRRADELSAIVIGAAIEVHRVLGAGLLESIYERCLLHELKTRGILTRSQVSVPIVYKEHVFQESLKIDILVEDCLLLELKAVEQVLPIHKAQVLTYMKLMDVPVGLLLNFHVETLKRGIHRLILRGADMEEVDF